MNTREQLPTEQFPSVAVQARFIAYLYSMFGLWSIPVLTVCTVISMANVFTTGALATYPWVVTLWALIFSISIDVNIVRLFVEGTIEHAQGRRTSGVIAYTLGVILGGVTAISLFIEGIEQAIGLSWQSPLMQDTLTILVFLRVACVVVLFIREGHRLGVQVLRTLRAVQPSVQRPVRQHTPLRVPSALLPTTTVTQENVQASVLRFPQREQPVQNTSVQTERETHTLARLAVQENPDISLSRLAAIMQVRSRSTARSFKQSILQSR